MYALNRHNKGAKRRNVPGLSQLRAWWRSSSDATRLESAKSAGWVVASAVGVVSLFAFVPGQYETHRANAEYAETVASFAGELYGDQNVVSVTEKPILEQDWVGKVSEQVSSDDWNPVLELARLDDYVDGFETLNVSSRSLYETAETAVNEHNCLATAIYYEARSESLSGQLAVAEVIANRVKDARYPNTICEVVYQGSRRNIGCQFTFTCDGALNRKPRGVRWQRSKAVAAQVVLDLHEPRTAGATHYHANYVDPIWNAGLVHTKTIGTHIFYRFPRGKEWGIYRARLAEKRANRRRVIQTVADTAPAASEGVIVDATAAPAP